MVGRSVEMGEYLKPGNKLGIGISTLMANGVTSLDGISPHLMLNYVCSEPRLALNAPHADFYLAQTAIPALREGEHAIVNTVLPGLLDLWKHHGLIPDESNIIQVNPDIPPFANYPYGYPHTDLLSNIQTHSLPSRNGTTPVLISTFSNDKIRAQAQQLGFDTVGTHSSVDANSKARLREHAAEYGIKMLPGTLINSDSNLERIAEEFKKFPHGAFLKYPAGSGGDLGLPVKIQSVEDLHHAIRELRERVQVSLTRGKFGITIDDFWPADSPCPIGLPLVIETHYANFGELVINGSSQFLTTINGKVDIYGHFGQMTTEVGEYVGNYPLAADKLDATTRARIEAEVRNVGKYNIEKNSYYGIQGVDWFLIRDEHGKLQVYVDELNSRPTANTPPFIMAQKLNASHWVNTNCYPIDRNRTIRTIDDFIALVGHELALGANGSAVIPQAFRTLTSSSRTLASPDFKCMVIGQSEADPDKIALELIHRGISLDPPN